MAKVLFFFTSSYPFGSGETFIENEIGYLSNAFDKIIIVSNNCHESQTRNIPKNCSLIRYPYELSIFRTFFSVVGIFSTLFWKEHRIITSVYKTKIRLIILKTMLISLEKTKVFGKRIKKIIKTNSIVSDQVYCYSYWANDTAFALAQLKQKLPQAKMLCRAHGWDVYFDANKANYLPFRKDILQGLDRIFFISQRGFDYYKKLFPELVEKMNVSKLGVPGHARITSERQHPLRLVSCSNIIPIKRLYLIVEALKFVDFDIEWDHFGTGFLMDSIKQLCKQCLYPKKNIQYTFHGNISNSEIIQYYSKNHVDLFINVSSSEGIPVSIMEAISLGIPCIATAVGGTPEIVKNSYNGFLLPGNPSPEEIADTIKKFYFLKDEEKTKLRENAYKTWDEEYNAEKNYKEFTGNIFNL